MAEISPRGSLGSPCLVYKGVIMIQEGALQWIVLYKGYCHNSFPRYRGGIEAHGRHDVEAVSCGYSGTPLARVKLFE